MPVLVISSGTDWKHVGFWIGKGILCFKHWDNRRNPCYYQPAIGLDLDKYGCVKCKEEEEKNKAHRLKMAKLGH